MVDAVLHLVEDTGDILNLFHYFWIGLVGCSIQIISTISWMPVTIRRECFRCYPYPPEKGWIRKVNLGAGEAGPPGFP